MIEDVDCLFVEVEFGLPHLLCSRLIWVQIKPLGHLLNRHLHFVVVLLQSKVLVLDATVIWIEAATSVSQLVRPVLVLFNDLILVLANELLSQDKTVVVSMVVVVELLVLPIDLN